MTFCEDEIVAGDIITIELDPDVFKMIQEAANCWSDEMALVRMLHEVVYFHAA